MSAFDPNQPTSVDNGIFGLPFSYEESKIAIQQVPWEVTTSYGAGASLGPRSILNASHQLDLFHLGFGNAFKAGYHLLDFPEMIFTESNQLKEKAQWIINEMISEDPDPGEIQKLTSQVNERCTVLNDQVYKQAKTLLEDGKIPALLGGDHSTPFGNIQAVAEKHLGYSILHIDAHHDLRAAYQGFTHSHASILYNVMESNFKPSSLVQVGIRDFCEDEFHYAKENGITVFYDRENARKKADGVTWNRICNDIIAPLSDEVYITVDIDGLSPDFCPNTGTPVPGGLSYNELSLLLEKVAENKKIVGFDLVEVAPDPTQVHELDANVGARVLFELCGWTVQSHGGVS